MPVPISLLLDLPALRELRDPSVAQPENVVEFVNGVWAPLAHMFPLQLWDEQKEDLRLGVDHAFVELLREPARLERVFHMREDSGHILWADLCQRVLFGIHAPPTADEGAGVTMTPMLQPPRPVVLSRGAVCGEARSAYAARYAVTHMLRASETTPKFLDAAVSLLCSLEYLDLRDALGADSVRALGADYRLAVQRLRAVGAPAVDEECDDDHSPRAGIPPMLDLLLQFQRFFMRTGASWASSPSGTAVSLFEQAINSGSSRVRALAEAGRAAWGQRGPWVDLLPKFEYSTLQMAPLRVVKTLGASAERCRVVCVAVSSGSLLAACTEGSVAIWDLGSGVEVARQQDHDIIEFKLLAFHPDGRTLAVGGGAGMISIWHFAATGVAADTFVPLNWVRRPPQPFSYFGRMAEAAAAVAKAAASPETKVEAADMAVNTVACPSTPCTPSSAPIIRSDSSYSSGQKRPAPSSGG